MHHLECLIWVLLSDTDENQVVKDAFGRQGHIYDFWKIHLEHRQKNSDTGVADVEIFHWRFADYCCGGDRVASGCDRGQMENGIVFDGSVKTRVITKRSFRMRLPRLNIAFQNEINVCRHIQLDRCAPNMLDGFPSQKSGKQQLAQAIAQWRGRRERINRVATQSDSDGHALTAFVVALAVARSDLMNLPVHSAGALVIDLHPVNAYVARACFRIARVNIRQGNETPAILWPAFKDRKIADRKAVATLDCMYYFLAGRLPH